MAEVLIVGGGPTGLAAGLFLRQHGISARIVEKAAVLSRQSKAFGVNPRTLSLLEPTGVTERMLAEGWRAKRFNIWRHQRRVAHLDLSRVAHRFPFMLILSQARSEALIAEALAERGVHVEFQTTATGIETNAAGSCVRLEHHDGRIEETSCRYLLGADGPRSQVRECLGVGFPGSTYEETWKLYDLVLDPPVEPNEGHACFFDDGGMLLLRLHGDVWRVLGNVPNLLDRVPSGTRMGEVQWESDFIISHRLCERFLVGSTCLAGDAAHLHSPVGARGMNLGIEDAFVYAKLVAAGRVHEYEALRRPVVSEVVKRIAQITEIPRGKSLTSRFARRVMPVIGFGLPLFQNRLLKWVLGLDHEVV